MYIQLIGWLFLSLQIATAVFVENAFSVSEAVNYLYGTPLTDIHIIAGDLVVGKNSKGHLVGIDSFGSGEIKWKLQKQDLAGVSDLLYTQDQIYGWSQGQRDILVIDSDGGFFKHRTEYIVKKMFESKYGGVFILDNGQNLHYLDKGLKTHLVDSNVSDENIFIDCNGGTIQILIGGEQLISYSADGKVNFKSDCSLGSVKEFKDGLVITENDQVFKLDGRNKALRKIENNLFKNLLVVNHAYMVSDDKEEINLISIEKEHTKLIHRLPKPKSKSKSESFSSSSLRLKTSLQFTPLNSFLIFTDERSRKVFDLTDFLHSGDIESIKKIQFKLSFDSQFEYLVKVKSESKGLAILGLDENLNGELFSLFDGRKLKDIAPRQAQYSSQYNDNYIIIDPPHSTKLKSDKEVIQKETDNALVFTHWLSRTIRHLSEIGRAIFNIRKHFISDDVETFAFNKLIIFYDANHGKLVALNSHDDGLAWETNIFNNTGSGSGENHEKFIKVTQLNSNGVVGPLIALFESHLLFIDPETGNITGKKPNNGAIDIKPIKQTFALEFSDNFVLAESVDEDVYFVKQKDNTMLSGHLIPKNELKSIQTWTYNLQEHIVAASTPLQESNSLSAVSSIGIPLHDKSVLYKYLNPNLLALMTFKETLKLYLIDGISGNLLYTHVHPVAELIDPSSVRLVADDNWLVYTFFTKSPRLEQRINVVDLFNGKSAPLTQSLANVTIDSIFTKSFIYPEKILQLSSTKTNWGITLKSIIAFTESGNLVELPKFVLNPRRPEHQMSASEYQDDFRLMPYDPIIPKNNFQTINHKFKLEYEDEDVEDVEEKDGYKEVKNKVGAILVQPTQYESTVVLCFMNSHNQFCSLVQPSASFDLLGKNFEKIKLVLTIIALLAVYIATKPYVSDKKLKSQWIDLKKKA
ncbi:hypothetical protein PVL30_004606 [Lodderomyces elongisporus]|uniref:uncharacterized protein n=1 Tax=Lodderomyces elongisporus TaxID=36914 RepID=UPI0029239332|nr:uncharacterized protein PVL30_004606 [Lodderomyces elongisporus]WLF80816.1 hypothetical protein PVL30_004606 [Lodderomyces elongisporus]